MCGMSHMFYGIFHCCSEAWLSAKVNTHWLHFSRLSGHLFLVFTLKNLGESKYCKWLSNHWQGVCLQPLNMALNGPGLTSWILNIQCRLDANKKNPLMGCTHMQCRCQSLTVVVQQRLPHTFLHHMWYSLTLPSMLQKKQNQSQVLASAA